MLVKDLKRRLKAFPPKSTLRATSADGTTVRQLHLKEAGHHNAPADIAEGDTPHGHVKVALEDGIEQVEVHPVEIFAGGNSGTVTVKDVMGIIDAMPDEAMIRVAVPSTEGDVRYHRVLTIDGVGFADDDGDDGELVVQLTCERWDGQNPVIRVDQ